MAGLVPAIDALTTGGGVSIKPREAARSTTVKDSQLSQRETQQIR
jgi:hypothetical protein